MAATGELAKVNTRRAGYPAATRLFEGAVVALAGFFLMGIYLDGWAHNHVPELETFFTPWHAVLYTGFFGLAALLVATQFYYVSKGYLWARALPQGYGLSLVGMGIFFASAGGDFAWHSLFGIERTIDALFSPTHLLMISGALIMITGPLRAAWQRANLMGWRELLAPLLTLLYILSAATFMTQFANLMISPTIVTNDYSLPANEFSDVLAAVTGIASILVPAALTLTVLLFAMKRWQLPFGTFILFLGVNNAAMYLMRANDLWRYSPGKYWVMVIPPFVVGLCADMLYRWWKPSAERRGALRLFAFLVPFALYTSVILTVGAVGGIRWEIHMLSGVPFLAGMLCVGLSYLVTT